MPSRLYIAGANNGNTAANKDLKALFEAIADAAMGRYAVTRYVKVDVNPNNIPVPNGIEAMIGTIQCTCGYVVNASQKSPECIGCKRQS